VPPAAHVTGVDSSAEMLQEYAAACTRRGVAHDEVTGDWPAIAPAVEPHDLVVCHHVLYNTPDLPEFAAALTERARRRVVVELTATHPLASSAPLWQHFHGLDRPAGPTADLAAQVLADCGITVRRLRWRRPPRNVPREVYVRLNRRRLCLPADADPEVDRLMGDLSVWRDVVTLWWDVDGPQVPTV